MGLVTVGFAEENRITSGQENNLTFRFDQRVSGSGFFSAYKCYYMPDAFGLPEVSFNGVETKSIAHGSGTIDIGSSIYAESYHIDEKWANPIYDVGGESIDESEDANGISRLKEDGRMIYAPISMTIDSSYYKLQPIVFNSLLKEDAWIKNRDNLNSINYMAGDAHKLARTIDIQADSFSTSMNIVENLTNGKVHFGVLQLAGIPMDELSIESWKMPSIEMGEDYMGTFDMAANMDLESLTMEEDKDDNWLPCCSRYDGNGGWYDMNQI
ncbi:MAG: hypothetical protein ACE14P_02295 [Methanotrichaceae archaeon]